MVLEFLKDFKDFMLERKKYWIIPIVLTLMILGFLIYVGQHSAVAPFVYTVF